jgi:sterol desaturase/sphingolipid hydroxylase (fatty acid hydroxylase superfamily)
MENLIRLGCFLAVLLLMLFWEWRRPFRDFGQSRFRRLCVHLGLMLFNFACLRLLSGGGAYVAALYAERQHIGLLHVLHAAEWAAIASGLIVFDLAIYLQHVAYHRMPWLWRLHKVHHVDLGFDASTAIRFHPGEIVLSMYYKMLLVLALGIPSAAVLAFEILLNACSLFNHGNVRIAEPWEWRIRCLLITPDMHRVHHSSDRRETDSNYGFSVPLWDHLCGTYRKAPRLGHERMEIGQGRESAPEGALSFWGLLRLPFK